jgi:hypothetical protein
MFNSWSVFFYIYILRHLAKLGLNHDGVDILIMIPVFLVSLAITHYFFSKIPDGWFYWKKSEFAPNGIVEDTT